MLLKILREEADYIAIVFDTIGPTFRTEIFKEYKANRPPMPDALSTQIPYIKRITAAYSIPVVEKSGYEADDIIATLAQMGKSRGVQVIIVTGDKDLMQLVEEGVLIYDELKDRRYTPKEVKERFGVPPDLMADFLAIAGDSIDNIPGAKGIGTKGAVKLVSTYGKIEQIFKDISKIKEKALQEKLINSKDAVLLSKRLTSVDRNVPLGLDLSEFKRREPDIKSLHSIFVELEFNRLLKELPSVKTISYRNYKLITSAEELETLVESLSRSKYFSIDLETTSVNPMDAELVGISISNRKGSAVYIPVGHTYVGAPAQLKCSHVLQRLRPLLSDPKIKKIGQNIKYDQTILGRYAIELKGIYCDTMIASYLLNPSGSHSLERLAAKYLGHRMIRYEEVTGGKDTLFSEVDVERAKIYSCEDADVTYRLAEILLAELEKEGLSPLLKEIEIPLIGVLVWMETNGVKLDRDFLGQLSAQFLKRLQRIQRRIYELAGQEFNIDSPKQLQQILFSKLGLPSGKRTKTGFSTDVNVLEKLAQEHPLPEAILQYRSLAKLKNTYVDALPRLINPDTGRVHTSYHQTITATGRLSSSDPNLQNIPVRTQEGRLIRKAFVPEKGNLLVSADYSQIELRILAHLSGDQRLVRAFREGRDIHDMTAGEIFGVSGDLVTSEMRRKAKAVNFGIIYGLSAHGLAQQLGVPHSTAQQYIDSYFARYEGVKHYLETTLQNARTNGFVCTLMGRKRYLPELSSGDRNIRSAAERMAINTPIQGTAADLIKLAMIRLYKRINSSGSDAKMILQVHDELVFEVPQKEVKRLKKMIVEEMEHVIDLDVPLSVSISEGLNWAELQ
jgi:DNA polymerase-1